MQYWSLRFALTINFRNARLFWLVPEVRDQICQNKQKLQLSPITGLQCCFTTHLKSHAL